MKVTGLNLLLAANAAYAAPSHFQEKRQIGGAISALLSGDTGILGALANENYGRVNVKLPGEAPTRTTLKSDLNVPGVKRVKIRTGPYLVPGMNHQNRISKHWGMLESYYDAKIEKPCSECNILRQVSGLEYANGTNANIDSGLWLHHMVHLVTGPRRWDAVGIKEPYCLTHEGINSMPAARDLGKGQMSAKTADRYFVTGNERLPFHYYSKNVQGGGSAFHLDAQDKFYFLVELMNMNMEDKHVWITMTYDIIDGALPSGWQDVKAVFLDANSCKSSEVKSPAGKTVFEVPSVPWRPNFEGKIIDSMGHLHDGGIEIDIIASGSQLLCSSKAIYSGKPEYVFRETSMAMHGDKVAKDHISDMAHCGPNDIRVERMTKGQSWAVKGRYDYNIHAANLEAGKPSEIMAIAIVLVAVPPGNLRPS